MRLLKCCVTGILLPLTLMSPASAAAQEHVVDAGQLAAIVAGRQAQQDRDRATIHEALARREVRDMAKKIGADMERVAAAVDTLSDNDLERTAAAARQVNDRLVGGASTITISTTTIIIGLLVLILLIVALR